MKKIGVFILELAMICVLFSNDVVRANVKNDYYCNQEMDDIENGEKKKLVKYIKKEIHEDIHSNIDIRKCMAATTDSFSPLISRSNSNSLKNNYRYSASIDNEREAKFCEFTLTEKAKVSFLVQMATSLNLDVYLFLYQEDKDTLVFLTGSAKVGKGVSEYVTGVFDEGTYYIAFSGQEGTGNFNFAYYQSNADINYELNDSISMASTITLNTSITGVIDNPYDLDYYKIIVTKPTLIECSFINSLDYSLTYKAYSGEGAKLSVLNAGINMMTLLPGTYYFLVQGGTKYSATTTYSICFTKISECSTVDNVPVQAENDPANIKIQYDYNGENCYVNGNPVNINYHYNYVSSVSAQSYDIQIRQRNDVVVDTFNKPRVVYYKDSTKPARKCGERPAVLITFVSASDFYSIHCNAMYRCDDYWKDFKSVTVLIDPDTGKLIDIENVNYFYDIAKTGTNYLNYTTSIDTDTVYKGGD